MTSTSTVNLSAPSRIGESAKKTLELSYYLAVAFVCAGCTVAPSCMVDPKVYSYNLNSAATSESFYLGGDKLTITGSRFTTGMTVQIEEFNCANPEVIDASTMTCTVPDISELLLVQQAQGHAVGVMSSTDKAINSAKLNIIVTWPNGKQAVLPQAFQYKSDSFTKVELFSGNLSYSGRSNGIGTSAKFYRPSKGVIVGSYMYVTDTENQMIRRVNMTTFETEDFAGQNLVAGSVNGIGTAATFSFPMGIAAVGNVLYVADNGTCIIRKIDIATRAVSTIAGSAGNCTSSFNATGTSAGFDHPTSVATDGSFLYIADASYNLPRIALSGSYPVTRLNATPDYFYTIVDLVVLNGFVYVNDYEDAATFHVQKIQISNGAETHLQTTSSKIVGIETDGTYLYVSASSTNRLSRFDLSNNTFTVIAGSSTAGNLDGFGLSATLNRPSGLFFQNGFLYVASYGNHNIRRFDLATTELKTIVGNPK